MGSCCYENFLFYGTRISRAGEFKVIIVGFSLDFCV